MPSTNAQLIEMLLTRLERVPADSFWAHRASGVRGSLLDALEREENGDPLDSSSSSQLTREAIHILERAAREIGQAAVAEGVFHGEGRL